MGFKITLSDGRTFEEGQEVEIMYDHGRQWAKTVVGKENLYSLTMCPMDFRHIAPKVKRKRTAREVDQIINVERRRWRVKDLQGTNIGGRVSDKNGSVKVEWWGVESISYESPTGEWLPLAEVEE